MKLSAKYQATRRSADISGSHRGVCLRLFRPGWQNGADFLWGPTLSSAPAIVSRAVYARLSERSALLLNELSACRDRLLEVFAGAGIDDLMIGFASHKFASDRLVLELISYRTLPSGRTWRDRVHFEGLASGCFDRAILRARLQINGFDGEPDWATLDEVSLRVRQAADFFLPLRVDL